MHKIIKENYDYVTLPSGARQYDSEDLESFNMVDAIYVKSPIPEDVGNRFIEALPRPRSSEESKRAYNKPLLTYDSEKERALPSELRQQMVYRLREVRFPLPYQVALERNVYTALCLSYRKRYRVENLDSGFDIDIGSGMEKGYSKLLGDSDSGSDSGVSLLGYSGCGKSSTLKVLFSLYPQVIMHHVDGYQIPQIVYLVVNCIPNSNFSALYESIGNAIDRAFGLDRVYEDLIAKQKSLGKKAEKVRELVEKFFIGIIVFDEIQLIDFSSTKENSFESLMTLCNRTKVAIGVVGTEDASAQMFKKWRTIRRTGPVITASSYCHNKDFFSFLVSELMKYQWFDDPVSVTDEMIDAFYINTKGIIDQLVSIYICMNIEYLSKKKRPVVDAHFINYVADKYYPQMKELLQDIDRPSNQKRITEVLQQGQRRLDIIREEAEQKIVADSIMKQSENIEEEKLLKNVIRNILKVTRAYSADKIHNAFEKLMNQEHSNDENDVTHKVYTMLESTAKKSTSKKTPILSHEAMRKELLEK